MSRRTPVLLLALAVCPAGSAAAQAPEARAALEAFRDTLEASSDTVWLASLERQLIAIARDQRDDVDIHLRLGFVALRLGDLGVVRGYEAAGSEFEWARDLEPAWPYPWYGIGLTEARIGDSQLALVSGIRTMFGKDALAKSALAFAKSAEVDPGFVKGLEELAGTALQQRVNIKLDLALEALRAAASTPSGQNPVVLLARGRVEREAGSIDSALVAFRQYLARGGAEGMGRLELARTRFLTSDLAARDDYLAGARVDDSASVAAYRHDLSYIATEQDLADFDAAQGDARADMLRRFWASRDAEALHPDGERLREHYRRVFYARQNFALVGLRRIYNIEEVFRSGSTEVDDRGVVYIRHGEPTDRATYAAPDLAPNESWRYTRPDGPDLIFHFASREDVQDFRLIESVLDVLGFAAAVSLGDEGLAAQPPNSLPVQLVTSREQLAPVYSRMQVTGRGSSARVQSQERELGRTSIAEGTTTDSHPLRFPLPLSATTQVFVAGSRDGVPLVHVTWAVPGSALRGARANQGMVYPIRLRFSATRGGTVGAHLDTTRVFFARQPVPPTEHLVGHTTIPLEPGTWNWRIAVQEGEHAGIVTPSGTLEVAPVDGSRLALSHPVLGVDWSRSTWMPSPADTVRLNPTQVFWTGETVDLYYEVYGLLVGETYRTEIALNRGDRAEHDLQDQGRLLKDAALTLKFDESAVGSPEQARRTLELRKLKPGRYTLTLLVTDQSNRTSRRSATFEVAER